MKRRRPWLLIPALATTLVAVTVVTLWWYLPIAAPAFVFRQWPAGEPAERAVVRMVELIAQDQGAFADVLRANHDQPRVTAGLLRALADRRVAVRLAAIALLVGSRTSEFVAGRTFLGFPASAIVGRLRDSDARIRLKALWDLRLAPGHGTLEPALMRDLARDPDPEVRMEVARYARAQRRPAIAGLLLEDGSAVIREIATDTIGGSRDPLWIPPLIHLLDDPEQRVRVAAAKALGDLDDERALPALVAGLRVADPLVREAMAGALGRIEDIRARPPLIIALGDGEARVRRAAANALGVIGDPRAIAALAHCAGRDDDRSVRCAAVSALDAIKDPATLDPLLRALHDPDAVVRAMAEAALARRP
jgi:hypothetical protein